MLMPRAKQLSKRELVERAMHRFWRHGYTATSIADLVASTGASRQALYSDFGSKHGLYLAALDAYRSQVVSPAFGRVEAGEAGLAEIWDYFEQQIALAEAGEQPGPGCLIANTMVESGPHDPEFMEVVQDHLERLTAGFNHALVNERRRRKHPPKDLSGARPIFDHLRARLVVFLAKHARRRDAPPVRSEPSQYVETGVET